jgi:hypothetical protein
MMATNVTRSPEGERTLPASGRLHISQGIANLILRADRDLPGLYVAHFEGKEPRVEEDHGTVRVAYPWALHPFTWGRTAAEITLNGAVPWDVQIERGVSRMAADLRGLQLGGLRIGGGASRVDLWLPEPSGTVRISVGGGASHLSIRRPEMAPVRISVQGGLSRLALDDMRLGAVGGPVDWDTPGYKAASDRYVVEVGGGASHLTIAAV